MVQSFQGEARTNKQNFCFVFTVKQTKVKQNKTKLKQTVKQNKSFKINYQYAYSKEFENLLQKEALRI